MSMTGLRLLIPFPYAGAALAMGRDIARHGKLLWNLSRRDVRDRYLGQTFGLFWAILNPMLTIIVYLFVFAFVFQARMPQGAQPLAGREGSYVLYLLSGLIPWLGMQEAMTRSVNAITGNSSLVKQVIFPLEVLPLKILWGAFLSQCVMLALFIGYSGLRFGWPSAWLALLPFLLLTQYLAAAGLALLFAAVAPYFRDIKDVIGLMCLVLLFGMPVFYAAPAAYGWNWLMLQLNPFTHMVECYHDVLFRGTVSAAHSWAIFPLFALVVFALGSRVFQTLKTHFGNVL